MKLTILGCGPSGGVPLIGCTCPVCTSDHPRNRRSRASVMLESETRTRILIDASPDLRAQALMTGIHTIDALLITHAHADHCHGLDDVRSFNFHKDGPIDLYTDAHTMQELQARFTYIFRDHVRDYGWYKPEFTCHTIDGVYDELTIGDIALQVFQQDHGKVQSLGVRIGDMAYCTDVKSFPQRSFAMLQGLDTLVIDCLRFSEAPTHAHLDLTLSWIEQLRPRRAILTHMGHELDYTTLPAQLPAGVEMAYDGMEVHSA